MLDRKTLLQSDKLLDKMTENCMEIFKKDSKVDKCFAKSVHKGLKDFSCKSCDKSYTIPSDLKTHMHKAHGEKTFKCSACDKAFNTNLKLLSHINSVHVGLKVFSCNM